MFSNFGDTLTGIFSALSGQFTKYLIVGTFLPVLVFVVTAMVILSPLLPEWSTLAAVLGSLDKQWVAILVTFVTVLLTGVLYNLNIPIIRFYEGYPWQYSWAGQFLISRRKREFNGLTTARADLRLARISLQEIDRENPIIEGLQSEQDRIARTVLANFPQEERLILPTRLGNATRSFEDYSRQQYGLDAIFLWPRIIAVANKDYLAAVDDAKSSVDFFLNCSVLSAFLGASIMAAGLASKKPFAADSDLMIWIGELVCLCFIAWLTYLGAINRVVAWGGQVKGVFDLYRWDLLKQLGYAQKPTSRIEERKLWQEISQQVFYGDPKEGTPWPYADERQVVSGTPADAKLEVASGTSDMLFQKAVKVHYRIRNVDPEMRTVNDLSLMLDVPGAWSLKWNSAGARIEQAERVPLQTSTSPVRFNLGQLNYDQELEFQCVFNLISAR